MQRLLAVGILVLTLAVLSVQESDAAWVLGVHGKAQAQTDATVTLDTTGATFIVVMISDFGGAGASTLTDGKGNTTGAALETQNSPAQARLRLFAYIPSSVGSGHTFKSTGTTYATIAVAVFTGNGASPNDQHTGTTFTDVTSVSSGSITPSQDNELIVTAIGSGGALGVPTYSVDSVITITDQGDFSNGNWEGGALAYKIQTTAAAINAGWSWTNSHTGGVAIHSFKDTTVVGGTSSGWTEEVDE